MSDLKLSRRLIGKIAGEGIISAQLSNGAVDVEILNYGGLIKSIRMPDRYGVRKNIVAGFETGEAYLGEHPYIGCMVGRYANRISRGRFVIDGIPYQLSLNDGANHLHGGHQGFDKKVWALCEEVRTHEEVGVKMYYESKDGEEGYPGNLEVFVSYALTTNNALTITSSATTDKATPVNVTNHAYFNLTGFERSTILDHSLQVHGVDYAVKNENDIPTGEILPVRNTPLDFITPRRIGDCGDFLFEDDGYNHFFVLPSSRTGLTLGAELFEQESGRYLRLMTDQPGLQVYTANAWDGSITGAQGVPYVKYGAIALEAQNFPDGPNHAHFPNCILRPGEVYGSRIVYQFLVK